MKHQPSEEQSRSPCQFSQDVPAEVSRASSGWVDRGSSVRASFSEGELLSLEALAAAFPEGSSSKEPRLRGSWWPPSSAPGPLSWDPARRSAELLAAGRHVTKGMGPAWRKDALKPQPRPRRGSLSARPRHLLSPRCGGREAPWSQKEAGGRPGPSGGYGVGAARLCRRVPGPPPHHPVPCLPLTTLAYPHPLFMLPWLFGQFCPPAEPLCVCVWGGYLWVSMCLCVHGAFCVSVHVCVSTVLCEKH